MVDDIGAREALARNPMRDARDFRVERAPVIVAFARRADPGSGLTVPSPSQVFKKCSEHKLANTMALKGVCRTHPPLAPPPGVARVSRYLVANCRLRAPAARPSPRDGREDDEPVSRSIPFVRETTFSFGD